MADGVMRYLTFIILANLLTTIIATIIAITANAASAPSFFLDWAKVIVEYNERWGIMNGRAERTLKRIQARAIKRILNCMCEIDALKSTPDNNTADIIPADA